VNDETLALGLIHEMKSQANYLSSDFTLKHFRKELATLNLVNRHRRSGWEKRGAKSLEEVAGEQVEKILKKPPAERKDSKTLEKVRSLEKKWLERVRK
jgi:trimethylamine:corrinoid methyltransferase-like protein